VGACSASFSYTHDNVAPTRPTLTGTTPASPSNSSTTPTVNGTTSEANVTVRLYKTNNCSGTIAAQPTIATTSFAISASVTANTTTAFSATAVDAAGNVSSCATSINYTHDNVAPPTPVITATNPVSPSNSSTSPQVIGTTSDAGLTVNVYTNASCTGSPLATGTSTASGSTGIFSVAATAASNATTTFYVAVRDAAGNASGCSAGFAYTHDNRAPGTPTLTGFTPASPSTTTANAVVVGNNSDMTAAVYIYPSANCTGTPYNPLGTVVATNPFSIAFTPTTLGCTPVSARAIDPAGNQSPCSNSLTFAHYGCAQCPCAATDWIRTFGTSGSDGLQGAVADSSGNVYAVGIATGALPGQTHAGAEDAFLVRYSAAGVPEWTRQFGTSAYDAATAVRVDASGNIYVAGTTRGDINATGRAVQDCPATQCGDAFIAKYSSGGVRAWINRFEGARAESVVDLEWDVKEGRMIMLLSSQIPGGNGISPQVMAVNITTGAITQVWAYIEDNQNKNPGGLAVDTSANIFVGGRSQNALPNALSTTGTGGNGVAYVYKITGTGTVTWVQHWGSAAHDIGTDLAVDGSGNVTAVGYLQGDPQGDPQGTNLLGAPYRGANGTDWNGWGDAAIARFNSAGTQQWVRIFGTPLDDMLTSVWHYDGRIHVTGQTRGNAETGTNTSKFGGIDFFIANVTTAGGLPTGYLRQFGTNGDDTVARAFLTTGGLWYVPGASSADWTGLSRDACTYKGSGDARLSRFCAPTSQSPPSQ
jgi:hypothetical protein